MAARVGFDDMTPPVLVGSVPVNPVEERLTQPQTAPLHAIVMLERVLIVDHGATIALRARRGIGTPSECAVFQYPPVPPEALGQSAMIRLPFLFNPIYNGMEAEQDFLPTPGSMIANDYRIDALIGQGTYCNFVSAVSTKHQDKPVGIKILRNSKGCFHSGLAEVRMYSLIRQHDPEGRRHIVRMLDAFYSREHLFIVTELLNNSLLAHYMHLESLGGHARAEYYAANTLGALSTQMLDALDFLQGIGIAHCDVKPANICIADSQARHFKLVDLGAAVLAHDTHNSYVQSRWYRAPEVILGCEWGPKVDVWALGVNLAELVLGFSPFQFPSSELVLAAQKAARGSFPQWMLSPSPLVAMFFTPSGYSYEVDPTRGPAGVYVLRSTPGSSLSAMLEARADPAIFGDLPAFTAFVEALLTIDPNERPTAAAALQHEWLTPYRFSPQ